MMENFKEAMTRANHVCDMMNEVLSKINDDLEEIKRCIEKRRAERTNAEIERLKRRVAEIEEKIK